MAANPNRPRGLKLVGTLTGAPPRIKRLFVDAGNATALYIGDPVSADETGKGDTVYGVQAVGYDVTTAHNLIGVVVGVDQQDGVAIGSQNFNRLHRPASTAMYVEVCVDPLAIYECQEDSLGNSMDVDSIGCNVDAINAAGGSTVTGLSGVLLDSTSAANTSTLNFRIVGFEARPDNVIGDDYGKWLVMINNHFYNAAALTALAE